MSEPLPTGNYTAIVAYTKTINLESGSKVLVLQMIITRGPCQGQRCERKLFFAFDQEQLAKSRFIRMGGILRSLATVEEDAVSLVGSLLSIQVRYDDVGRQKALICQCLGRDNVKKYL